MNEIKAANIMMSSAELVYEDVEVRSFRHFFGNIDIWGPQLGLPATFQMALRWPYGKGSWKRFYFHWCWKLHKKPLIEMAVIPETPKIP